MSTESEPKAKAESLSSQVGRLAHAIEHVFSPGDVAELRRIDPLDPGSPAFWKVVVTYLEDDVSATGARRDDLERRWAVILRTLAQLRGLHRPGRPLGRALAEAGLAEGRFVRLLRARQSALFDAVRVTGHFLASKAVAADLAGVARLVLSDARSDRETVRRTLARTYYRHVKEL